MSKRLFVGGLAWATTEEGLREAFKDYGVLECKIITHREGEHEGKSKGFAFVNVERGDEALAEMDGFELDGRYIRVAEAHRKDSGDRRDNGRRDNGGNGRQDYGNKGGGRKDRRDRRDRREGGRSYE
jgi:cold-inducible RNA-binding protein